MGKKQQVHNKKPKWQQGFDRRTVKALQGIPPPRPAGVQKPPVVTKKMKKAKSNALFPYTKGTDILVVGDGNFSWSAALCARLGSGAGIMATCYDSEEAKYADAQGHIDSILAAGGMVLFGIDGTKLHQYRELQTYDVVVFNFPHCGLGIKDQAHNIAANQELLANFILSARRCLQPGGELHITIKKGLPYDNWHLVRLALGLPGGIRLKNSFDFAASLYPGYEHRRTLGYDEAVSNGGNEVRCGIMCV